MNNLSQKLNKYIKKLKTKYPYFEYNNALKDDFEEKYLLQDNFTIIIRGVSRKKTKEVHSFIRDIYSECIDNDELLPNIITLQNYSNLIKKIV
jgi:hypothetical protein